MEMTIKDVPSWAIHRRLYDWVLGFAATPIASLALFVIAFVEAFMPFVPPDALLIPMCLEKRRKSLLFALIATCGSIFGALVGFFVIASMTNWVFGAETIQALTTEFERRGSAYVFIAALTPIPFFAFTTAAGIAKLNFGMFLAACIVGRSLRYGMEAGIVWWIGQPAKQFIEKWFNTITVIACLIIVFGWYISTQLTANG